MNIGIVTVYDSANYGSFLQAYAMMNYLQSKGHTVKFIKSNKKVTHNILKRAILTKKFSVKNVGCAIDKIKIYKKDIELLPVTEQIEELDLIVIGSDTLWDIRRPEFLNPVFYGKIDVQIPKISYAVSCADSKACDFESQRSLAEYIKKLDKVFVRDKHTQEVIKEVLAVEAEEVCDPTILINNEFWNKKISHDMSEAVVVYTYSMSKNVITNLKRYANEKGLRLVSIGLYQSWCDEHINCSAMDFPAYLQNANLVVTNTFHGTIFSVLTRSKVISIEKGNKLKNLIESLNANQIALNEDCTYTEFCEKVCQVIDYKKIFIKIQELREKSEELFLSVINGK